MKERLIKLVKLVFITIIVIIFSFMFIFFLMRRVEIKGESMSPVLPDGSTAIINTISPMFFDLKRDDIIIYLPNIDYPDVYKIGRVIGIGGESVQIKDSKVFIDGKEYREDKGTAVASAGLLAKPVKVGIGEYIVLGDNRAISDDSRYEYIGVVSKKKIKGKIWARLSPSFSTNLDR